MYFYKKKKFKFYIILEMRSWEVLQNGIRGWRLSLLRMMHHKYTWTSPFNNMSQIFTKLTYVSYWEWGSQSYILIILNYYHITAVRRRKGSICFLVK